jgi:pimeloyl-ACP methyl ester carboxylesterase
MTTTAVGDSTTEALYWEARGSGRPVLLIAGTPGDGGQFDEVASVLAADHMVITYDRRGTSRSGAPAGWSATSVVEQAEDAAELLARIGVEDPIVYGTSNGAAIALELARLDRPRLAGLLLHEPPLITVLRDPEPVASAMGAVIGAAMEAGGPRAALDAFLRFAFGDSAVDGWSDPFRERMLSNAEMVFTVEMPAFQPYRPDPQALSSCQTPACVLVGEEQTWPFFAEAGEWLASQLGVSVQRAPGAHGPQFSAPAALAATIRRFAGSL